MEVTEYLVKALNMGASDIHITVHRPVTLRLNGNLMALGDHNLTPEETQEFATAISSESQLREVNDVGESDFSYVIPHISRFRINVYKQRRSFAISARVIKPELPTIESLGMPEMLKDIALKPRGLFLVTGPTGSGKSTTLAAMINHINNSRSCHILTLENPIEYLFRHNVAMINQREIGDDTRNFASGLRAGLREDPDVIFVGEMRDLETISTAVSAAETGHYVLSTLHTTSAASSVDRIIDSFPPHQQQQVRIQLSGTLQGILSQQLIPLADESGRVAAIEMLLVNDAVRNMIREGKTHQIDSVIQTNIKNGMIPMDYSLAELVKKGRITYIDALSRCQNIDMLKRYVQNY
jgi:twitching motility protein PilT